jgi:hypothetical protein
MKEQTTTKLEFLMKVNNNIIVQRLFNIKDYNSSAKSSIDLYNLIKDFKFDLERELKMKTATYMLDNMYEIMNNPSVLDTSYTDGPESFSILIKEGDVTICHREFDAKIYPPKIRYTVDVRPHLKNLLMSLTDIFSSTNLTYEYLGVPLEV